jgi:hypothetical protein
MSVVVRVSCRAWRQASSLGPGSNTGLSSAESGNEHSACGFVPEAALNAWLVGEATQARSDAGGFGSKLREPGSANMSDYRQSGIELEMFRVNPFRLFYPGQSYAPDDLDPASRPWELARTASKPKKVSENLDE